LVINILYICGLITNKYNTINAQSKYPFNVIDKKILKKLAQKLPSGSAKTIQLRIFNKPPHLMFSLRYIQAVFNPDDRRYNTIIIEEAIAYLEEYSDYQASLENRIIQS